MRIVLIGSNGLLGSAIKKYLNKLGTEALFLTHKEFELKNVASYEIIKDYRTNIVINTAAYLGVEPCEKNPLEAFAINTKAVGDLARFCKKNNVTLVQISTDGVFDGLEGNYDENSNPKPVNLYGLTKYGAEQLVSNLCDKYYIFRIPILFGKRENAGNIFIEKMYKLYLSGKKELRIADDVISRPSYSNDIGQKIIDLILQNPAYGIYHIFNGGKKASLYDFAMEFFQAKGINDLIIHKAKAQEFSHNELGIKPLDTTLISSKIEPLRDWKEAIIEYCSTGE